jgi:pimeloyl-ACP methyl ester carboxylesterase
MHADANGIRIHYRIDGREGTPWVTFITGIANDTTMWDGQMAALAEDFRLLRDDSRGHGGTQATAVDYSFDLLMGDVLGLWDALGIRASHLVGLGLGGATAIGLGIRTRTACSVWCPAAAAPRCPQPSPPSGRSSSLTPADG